MSGRVALAALTVVALLVSASPLVGAEASADGPSEAVTAVSSENIEETISYLESLGTREFHTEGASLAAEYIYDSLSELGLDVEYQEFELDSVTIRNVVATTPGTPVEEGVYLLGAHYDSENKLVDTYDEAVTIPAPGADDDASGVAAVIEIARVLGTSGLQLQHTLKFVAFGAEEMGYNNMGGLAGSAYFVEQEVAADVQYAGTAILDMIGYRNGTENVVSLIEDDGSHTLADAMVEAVDEHALDLRIDRYTAAWATYSDHSSFWSAGYPSVLVIEEMEPLELMPLNPNYHTSGDTLSTLSMDQVKAVSQALAGGLLELTAPEDEGGGIPTEAVVAGVAAGTGGIAVAAFYIRHRRSER